MTKGENTILKGKLFPALIKFTIPLALALLLQALYGAVDLIVVGKFGNTASISAVANGSQMMNLLTNVVTGLTMGVTVVIGHSIGAKDYTNASKAVGGTIKLFAAVTVVVTAVMVIFAPQIVKIMKVPDEAVAMTIEYLRICCGGLVFIVSFNVIAGIYRGVGNSTSPLIFIGIACAVNIILDLVLVGLFKMDAMGAAIATIIAQAVSVVFSVNKIRKNDLPFEIKRKYMNDNKPQMKRIFQIGGPIALQSGLCSLSFLIIMLIVNAISLNASATLGICEKLFLFLSLVQLSFMSSLSAVVAQNEGAGQQQRAIKAVRIAMIISVTYGVCMTLLSWFHGDMLASIFETNPTVIASCHSYLRGACLEYSTLGVVFCLLGYFNGLGKTTFVMIEGLVPAFCVRVPLCYYFSHLPNTNMFIIALSVSIPAVVSLIMCVVYYFIIKKKRKTEGLLG